MIKRFSLSLKSFLNEVREKKLHNLVTIDGFIGSELSELFPPLYDGLHLGSDEAFDLASKWMQECKSKHHSCQLAYHKPSEISWVDRAACVPLRLIHVIDGQPPRLVDNSSLEYPARYAALSYVWGKDQDYILTESSKEHMYKALAIERLPQTIMDALVVTLRLGLSYIWVDALCIQQDSDEDKEINISEMDRVYQYSEVTIIAGTAETVRDGFFQKSKPAKYYVEPFCISFPSGNSSTGSVMLGLRMHYNPSDDPINKRAWTLQERLMSTCLLVYSSRGLKWSCKAVERDPASMRSVALSRISHTLVLSEDDKNKDNDSYTAATRSEWLLVRDDYTSRHLTYKEDKLRAIHGIARVFADSTGWTYVAGLWEEYLFLDLHWHREITGINDPSPQPRPRKYIAPSFSWASMNGRVTDVEREGYERKPLHFRVLSCKVDRSFRPGPAKVYACQNAKSGGEYLEVEGRMVQLAWIYPDQHIGWDGHLIRQDSDQEGILGMASLDAMEPDLQNSTAVFCMAMSVVNYVKWSNSSWSVEGLVLQPYLGGYRRVGYFMMFTEKWFENVKEQQIRIF
jgi:hypothetical protein